MKACSKCGENREDADLIGDVCNDCAKDTKKTLSFWRYAFSPKFYILPFFAGVSYILYYMETGISLDGELYNPIKTTNMILALIVALLYKGKNGFFTKVGLYIVVAAMANLVSFATILGGSILIPNSQGNNKIISSIIQSTENQLPIQLNDEATYFKMTSDNSNSITGHIKFVNYTTADLLEGLTTKEFEEEFLMEELQTSCKDSGVQVLLKKGIIHHIKYYDKDNVAFAQISITDELCKSYY